MIMTDEKHVKLEVKEFSDKENTLYVAIALESIKKDEIVKEGNTKNGVTQASPSSVISVSDLFALVNKKKTLLKRRAWLKTTQTCRQQTISLQILYPLLSKMSIKKS